MAQSKRSKTTEKSKFDRLSTLPHAILIKILSLLPIKSAVKTSMLSHQWHYLWTHVTNFVFTRTCILYFPPDFSTVVNGILPQLTSRKINRVYLFLRNNYNHIESWIHNICTRNPEQIEVETNLGCGLGVINLPAVILQCQSLVELSLTRGITIKFPDDEGFVPILPKLKKLQLSVDSVKLSGLFKCCPLLEDLNLSDVCLRRKQIIDLSVNNLKRLVIADVYYLSLGTKFVINLSNLEEFTLKSPVFGRVHFIGDSSALMKADILINNGLPMKNDDVLRIAKLISRVKSLKLDISTLKSVGSLQNELVPVFHNLSVLKIMVDSRIGRTDRDKLELFLRSCPCLEVLRFEIDYKFFYVDFDDAEEIEMIEYLLKLGKDLKLLSVCYVYRRLCWSSRTSADVANEEYEFCEKLFGIENPSGHEIAFNGGLIGFTNSSFIPFESPLFPFLLGFS